VHHFWDMLEATVTDVRSLRRRTNMLIAIHLLLAAVAIAVLVLVVWRAAHLVTLTQRTNVETLVLAFVVIFLGFVLVSTFRAVVGSVQLLALRAFARQRGQPDLQRRAAKMTREDKHFYLDVIVRGPPGQPVIELPIADELGEVGHVRIERAEIAFPDAPEQLSHAVVPLILNVLERAGRMNGSTRPPRVVFWDSLNEEAAAAYAAQVSAFSRMREALATETPIWPELELDARGVEELALVLREATPLIRETLLLPDVEYSAEFRVPVIPEPLAFVQLNRRVEHADAVASMGCITIVTIVALAIVLYVIVLPPWVPSS